MIIAFPTSGETLEAPLDTRFGRARRFLLYDTDDGSFSLVDNAQQLDSPQGAGIQAAQAVVRSGAQILVTSHCGPKAFRVLSEAGVEVFNSTAPTIEEALQAFRSGRLRAAAAADVEGHWL